MEERTEAPRNQCLKIPKFETETPSLPQEIITEILSRLPVKSLTRFRCVSRSWLSLISSPKFVKAHLNISVNCSQYTQLIFSSVHPHFNLKCCSLSSLLSDITGDAIDIDYPMKHPHNSVWIVASCNGLICLAIEEHDVFLWNPSIRKSKRLPDSGVKLKCGYYKMYGFGYEESKDDYKVVGVFCFLGSGGLYDTEVKIYSLRTDSWRRIEDFPGGVPLNESGKFVNGKLHWSSCANGGGIFNGCDIYSLDLATEKYRKVEQPNYGEGALDPMLGVVDRHLSLCCNYPRTRVDVWVMKEYGVTNSWTKLVTIPYLDDPDKYSYSPPIYISEDGEILMLFGSIFVAYNPKDNTLRYPQLNNFEACLEADIYIESLVSPET